MSVPVVMALGIANPECESEILNIPHVWNSPPSHDILNPLPLEPSS